MESRSQYLVVSLALTCLAVPAHAAPDPGGLPVYPPLTEGVKVIAMARTYPNQPTVPGRQIVEPNNEAPYVITRPTPGQETYRVRKGASAYACQGMTYVGQIRFSRVNGDRAGVALLLQPGGKCRIAAAADTFRIARFEAYNAPAGHFEVAYAERSVQIIGADGKPFDFPERFHIARDEIERVAP